MTSLSLITSEKVPSPNPVTFQGLAGRGAQGFNTGIGGHDSVHDPLVPHCAQLLHGSACGVLPAIGLPCTEESEARALAWHLQMKVKLLQVCSTAMAAERSRSTDTSPQHYSKQAAG